MFVGQEMTMSVIGKRTNGVKAWPYTISNGVINVNSVDRDFELDVYHGTGGKLVIKGYYRIKTVAATARSWTVDIEAEKKNNISKKAE